jgi:hypothetical protein
MLNGIDIEGWLGERSSSVVRSEREIIFMHPGGRKSLLLSKDEGESQIGCPALDELFRKCSGGFIGDGFLLIGTPNEAVSTSPGVTIPSIEEIRSISSGEGIVFDEDETPFMTTGYMFVYAFSRDGRMRCHDRDFGTVAEDRTFSQVLNEWWEMVMAESNP